MAFYVPHAGPKAKIEGFQTAANPPSPTNTFDPSSLFFSGPIFPDAFRNANTNSNTMDFTDSLMSMIPQTQNAQQQMQQQQASSQNQQSLYGLSSYPSPLSYSTQQRQQTHQRTHSTSRDDGLDSPVSIQTSNPFFSESQQQQAFTAPTSIPSYLNTHQRPDSPGSGMASPSDGGGASPFPTHASHARIHGHRSPSIGHGQSQSRSRSRSRASKPPPSSRNGIGKGGAKRTSISSTPEEPFPPPPLRPSAIVIPTSMPTNQDYTHQLNSLGPHPISPLGIHSTQTAPSNGWFVPSSAATTATSQQVEAAAYGLPPQHQLQQHDNGMTQSFGQVFQPRSLSLGTNPRPGTSASASVLAGSMGVGSSAQSKDSTLEAASKQAAILNEKRRRRRESHNAVERRRRDNINEKISELSTLLPDCMLDSTNPSSGNQNTTSSPGGPIPTTAESLLPSAHAVPAILDEDGKETPAMKANKGIILRKSVEYIRYLQQLVRVQASRNRELEAQLSHYRDPNDMIPTSPTVGMNSANSFAGMLENFTEIDDKEIKEDSNSDPDEELEERGRGVVRGTRRIYGSSASASVGKGGAPGVSLGRGVSAESTDMMD